MKAEMAVVLSAPVADGTARLNDPPFDQEHERRDRWGGDRSYRLMPLALAGGPDVHLTEFTAFKHLDPARGRPSVPALARELIRFAHAIDPIFIQTSGSGRHARQPVANGHAGSLIRHQARNG